MMYLRYLFFYIQDFLIKFILSGNRLVIVPRSTRFIGRPILKIIKGAALQVGENVTFNSNKIDYHLNMHSPCKIILDKDNAIITIGDNTRIHGTCIHAFERIEIGRNCLIAANTQIMDCNGHSLSFEDVSNRVNTQGKSEPVYIKDNVWIGTNVIILPGSIVGEGSIISANSVVNSSIPPMCIAAGNPAKIIKVFEEHR